MSDFTALEPSWYLGSSGPCSWLQAWSSAGNAADLIRTWALGSLLPPGGSLLHPYGFCSPQHHLLSSALGLSSDLETQNLEKFQGALSSGSSSLETHCDVAPWVWPLFLGVEVKGHGWKMSRC